MDVQILKVNASPGTSVRYLDICVLVASGNIALLDHLDICDVNILSLINFLSTHIRFEASWNIFISYKVKSALSFHYPAWWQRFRRTQCLERTQCLQEDSPIAGQVNPVPSVPRKIAARPHKKIRRSSCEKEIRRPSIADIKQLVKRKANCKNFPIFPRHNHHNLWPNHVIMGL